MKVGDDTRYCPGPPSLGSDDDEVATMIRSASRVLRGCAPSSSHRVTGEFQACAIFVVERVHAALSR
jgi:hypothetical protein